MTSNLRVSLLLLIGADVIRPSLGWLLTPFASHNLATDLARVRDPEGFADLSSRCRTSGASSTVTKSALRRAATIVAAKGGLIGNITVGDHLELELRQDAGMRRTNRGGGSLRHRMRRRPAVAGPPPIRSGRSSPTTSSTARSPWAPAAAPTPPLHSCLRCPILRPDPAQRHRLLDVRDNLIARIAEARHEGWLVEVEGLQISLNGARAKLLQLDQLTTPRSPIGLGIPTQKRA